MLKITIEELMSNRERLRNFMNSLNERQRVLFFIDIISLEPSNKSFGKKLSDLVLKMDLVSDLMRFFKPVQSETGEHLEFRYYRESGSYGIIRINDEEALAHENLAWLRKLYKVVIGAI